MAASLSRARGSHTRFGRDRVAAFALQAVVGVVLMTLFVGTSMRKIIR